MGGDCLNTGCVPSKALIACARAIHSVKNLKQFGVSIPEGEVTIDFNFVMERMRKIRAKISHHDSVERYSKDFCKHVFLGNAKFIGVDKVEVTGDDGSKRELTFKKAMIATGASAAIPPIPGLVDIPFLTNSNFFNQTELPPRMLVSRALLNTLSFILIFLFFPSFLSSYQKKIFATLIFYTYTPVLFLSQYIILILISLFFLFLRSLGVVPSVWSCPKPWHGSGAGWCVSRVGCSCCPERILMP